MFKRIFKKKPKSTAQSLTPKGKPVDDIQESKTRSQSCREETDPQDPSSHYEVSSSASASRTSISHELSWSLPFRAKQLHSAALLPAQDKEDEGKLCLVLDMDETLIHCAFLDMQDDKFRQTLGEDRRTNYATRADFVFEVSSFQVEVRCRPGLAMFLEKCSKVFELVVFTASLEEYATKAMDLIDPEGLVKHRLYRPATVSYRGVDYVKDLSRLGRDMQRTVLIDNNHLAMLASPENSIAINDFMGDPNDAELYGAFEMLMSMKDMEDVRPFIKETFKTHLEIEEIFEQMECGDESIPPRPAAAPPPAVQPIEEVQVVVAVIEETKSVVLPPPIMIPGAKRNSTDEDDSHGTTPRVLAATYSHAFATPMRVVPRRLGETPEDLLQLPPTLSTTAEVSEDDENVVNSFQLRISEHDLAHGQNATILHNLESRTHEMLQAEVPMHHHLPVLQEVGP